MELSLPAFAREAEHQSHPLHRDAENDWIDANCYTDLWIELLHGLGLDPYPALACTLALDFEADQWTFFKPAAEELRELYGLDVIELAVYRSLLDHALAQIERGNVPVLEVDGFFLRDVVATYRTVHAKTTIAVVAADPVAGTARYVHNAGCFEVRGDDFDGVFRLGGRAPVQGVLPPYVEAVKLAGLCRRPSSELAGLARRAAARHIARRGPDDPFGRFSRRFDADVAGLAGLAAGGFDGFAFATLRQLGAGCALAARFLRWLASAGEPVAVGRPDGCDLLAGAEHCEVISRGAKRLILKAARTVATGRPLAAADTLGEMGAAWAAADRLLRGALRAGATA